MNSRRERCADARRTLPTTREGTRPWRARPVAHGRVAGHLDQPRRSRERAAARVRTVVPLPSSPLPRIRAGVPLGGWLRWRACRREHGRTPQPREGLARRTPGAAPRATSRRDRERARRPRPGPRPRRATKGPRPRRRSARGGCPSFSWSPSTLPVPCRRPRGGTDQPTHPCYRLPRHAHAARGGHRVPRPRPA